MAGAGEGFPVSGLGMSNEENQHGRMMSGLARIDNPPG
jgi:hypothetical protein